MVRNTSSSHPVVDARCASDHSPGMMKSSTTTEIVVVGVPAWILVISLVVLALITILTPLLLALLYRNATPNAKDAKGNSITVSFFQLPYVTWLLIHYLFPVLGITAVSGLGLAHVLDTPTVATLLSDLFGYVLGSAAKSAPDKSQPPAGSATDESGQAERRTVRRRA